MAYDWTDNPTLPGNNVDVTLLNKNLMHLKYDNTSGAIGLTNYVAEGRKFTVGADLNLTINAGRESISEVKVERTENILALTARRAQLIYDTKAGTTNKIAAAFPVADAGTVFRWIIDGSATIASTVGTNDLTKYGTMTQTVGWATDYAAQGNGSTGYYSATTGVGMATGANPFHYVVLMTVNNITGNRGHVSYGGYTATNWLGLITLGARVNLGVYGANYDTGFDVEIGKTYLFDITYDGTMAKLYVNGAFVYSVALSLNITAVGPNLMNAAGLTMSANTFHYFEIRNALRTPAQIAAASNALLLPCRYYTSETANIYTDIRAILPADSIAIGFAHTDGDSVVAYNGADYMYGRREGATGGNRRAFLGWKYYTSGTTSLTWENPFGTLKIKVYFTVATDAIGTSEVRAAENPISGSSNGLYVMGRKDDKISAQFVSGAVLAQINSVNISTGYLGCYAEVME